MRASSSLLLSARELPHLTFQRLPSRLITTSRPSGARDHHMSIRAGRARLGRFDFEGSVVDGVLVVEGRELEDAPPPAAIVGDDVARPDVCRVGGATGRAAVAPDQSVLKQLRVRRPFRRRPIGGTPLGRPFTYSSHSTLPGWSTMFTYGQTCSGLHRRRRTATETSAERLGLPWTGG